MKKLKLWKSKVRPGKREARLHVVVSEALAREIEQRAKIAEVDPHVMAERLIAFATLTAPDDLDLWETIVFDSGNARRLLAMKQRRR